jgi:SUMO ligase MMS21 Smc5/6 complex component
MIMVFWDVTQDSLQTGNNISQKCAASIFMVNNSSVVSVTSQETIMLMFSAARTSRLILRQYSAKNQSSHIPTEDKV